MYYYYIKKDRHYSFSAVGSPIPILCTQNDACDEKNYIIKYPVWKFNINDQLYFPIQLNLEFLVQSCLGYDGLRTSHQRKKEKKLYWKICHIERYMFTYLPFEFQVFFSILWIGKICTIFRCANESKAIAHLHSLLLHYAIIGWALCSKFQVYFT